MATFFGLVVVLASAFDALLGLSLRSVTTGDFGEWNPIVRGQVNADIVLRGSSRALTHYYPPSLEAVTVRTAYNIGLNGSRTDMQLARLKTYLRHNRKPQLVIHNLDAFSLQVTHGGVNDLGQYVPYPSEPALYEALVQIDAATWKACYLPLYGYAAQDLRFAWLKGLRHWVKPSAALTHYVGFMPRNSAWTGEFDQFRARHPKGVPIDIEPAGSSQLEDLLRLHTGEGIRVILSHSPE